MTLEEAEKECRSILDIQERYGVSFPSEEAAGNLARMLLHVLPVVRAAEEVNDAADRQSEWSAVSNLCRSIIKMRREMEE